MAVDDYVVCFAHGKESGPWGTKITFLAEIARKRGFSVLSPDYTFTHDADERVRHLLSLAPAAGRSLVLIGSSMGGYVSAMACTELRPQALMLLAPALYFDGYDHEPQGCPADTVVVHGWADDIVPVDRSLRFARSRQAELHLLNSGHTLNDQLPILGGLFTHLLEKQLLP